VVPGSDTAHLALLGYDPYEYYRGRGTFEALGAGIPLEHGDVAFRGNLCTVDDDWNVLDRRAGRDSHGMDVLYESIDGQEIDGVRIKVQHTVEHRGAVVFSGKGLSNKVGNTDPHEVGVEVEHAEPSSDAGKKIADVLNKFTRQVYDILDPHPMNKERVKLGKKPANILLCRGAGMFESVDPFVSRYEMKPICIAGGALYKGVARYIGFDTPDVPGATGTVETNLRAKADAVIGAASTHDFVFAHIKGTDSCGHDGKFDGKRDMVSRIDAEFLGAVKDHFDVMAITGDHSTPVSAGRHTADPVPVLLYHKAVRSDDARRLTEQECVRGALGHINGVDVLKLILDYCDKSHMFGE